ncbi:MAG TPA: DUF6282 family protein [Steroidobacteraceae bacterium]|nr:DUF6282 family protein [Steroidobacteraceae bacterium]
MRDDLIGKLLIGAIDLHCHSGPSVMPRRLNHVAAIREAEEAGLRAVLFKDHYYSVAPVAELLKETLAPRLELLTGVPLNNTVGGLNPYAVEHGFKLNARLVWMPTFSAANHIRHSHRKNYLATKEAMLKPKGLTVVNDTGELLDEAKVILDLIAQYDAVLSAGHLHISEIWPLFDEAKKRGVKRLLVNHPTFLIDASLADIKELAGMGAMLEHSCCMWAGVQNKSGKYTLEGLGALIKAGGVDHTIIGSDLGQEGNPTPVEGLRHVIGMCLDLGCGEADIRKMVGGNAARLMGLADGATR